MDWYGLCNINYIMWIFNDEHLDQYRLLMMNTDKWTHWLAGVNHQVPMVDLIMMMCTDIDGTKIVMEYWLVVWNILSHIFEIISEGLKPPTRILWVDIIMMRSHTDIEIYRWDTVRMSVDYSKLRSSCAEKWTKPCKKNDRLPPKNNHIWECVKLDVNQANIVVCLHTRGKLDGTKSTCILN